MILPPGVSRFACYHQALDYKDQTNSKSKWPAKSRKKPEVFINSLITGD
jgi:hypothetical protein